MKKQIPTLLNVLFGVAMIVFGLNKFFGFIAVDPPADEMAQTFLGTMFTSYLVKLVALAEIIGGALLLIPRTAFLGSMILLPVTVNIVAFHLFHDLPGNGLWVITTMLHIGVLFFQKEKLARLFENEKLAAA